MDASRKSRRKRRRKLPGEGTAAAPDHAAVTNPSTDRRGLSLVLIVTVGVLLLFVGKAFTIDDTLFLALADHLRQDPLNFYDFEINWYGVVMPMWHVTKNPPLTGYVLALASAIGGTAEIYLHTVFLLVAASVAAGTFALARRFCAHPIQATLLGILTPAFLVSATTVMCDAMMLALWVWAIWWWLRDVEGETDRGRAVAAVLVALAGMTKYFGFALVPLLLAMDLMWHRRLTRRSAWLLLPVAAAVAYHFGTEAWYGQGLLLDAASYSSRLREYNQGSGPAWVGQTLTGLVFLGGCLLPALVLAPLLWPRRWWIGGALAVLVATVASTLSGWLPGAHGAGSLVSTNWALCLQAWLMVAGGVSLLALTLGDWWRARSPSSATLVLWVLGTFVFAAYLNWVNNGRSNLPVAPVLGILIVRRLEGIEIPRILSSWRFRAAGGIALALALAVAYGDFARANRVRDTVERVARDHIADAPRTHFQGHWGFQYYMEQNGARPIDLSQDMIRAGELIVVPLNNTDVFGLPPAGVRLVERIERPRSWVHTVAADLGAGFYASNLGPLPFVIGTGEPALTEVYIATQDFQGRLPKEEMPWW